MAIEISKVSELVGIILLILVFIDGFFEFLGTLDPFIVLVIMGIIFYLIYKKKLIW